MADESKLEQFKTLLRERGVDMTLNWEAPRWKKDKARVQHYTFTGDNVRPRMLTCMIIDYGADGFGFYGESPSNNIFADVEAICGKAA